jgi:hypothetical protein
MRYLVGATRFSLKSWDGGEASNSDDVWCVVDDQVV